MNVKQIINLFPDDLLDKFSIETDIDKYSKKLSGKIMFKLLIYSILSYKDNSLRRMESTFESLIFSYYNKDSVKAKYNSISDRLSTMNKTYFELLYQKCVEIYSPFVNDNKTLLKFDSTIVSLSSSLLNIGYNIKNGSASKLNLIKYTIGCTNIPTIAHIYTEQSYTSENVALKETIFSKDSIKNEFINVFDKGITSRKTYDDLIDGGIPFVSRTNHNCKYLEIESIEINKKTSTKLLIKSDKLVYLFSSKKKTKHKFRLIISENMESKKEILFITSIKDLQAEEICDIYKKRWEIEVFFKFLKQELNFSHFINRSNNGIAIVLYTTLIASILLLVYKKTNNIKGYKIMKQKFMNELEWIVMESIVILCNGDPKKLKILKQKPYP